MWESKGFSQMAGETLADQIHLEAYEIFVKKPSCTCQDKACYANGGHIFSYGQLGPWHEKECDFYTPF